MHMGSAIFIMMPAALSCRCRVSRALLAALPPSLTMLRLHKCQVVANRADFPPQLVCTEYDEDHAGLCHATFELAATDTGSDSDLAWQLAPVALPLP
jgi:hypothetical protein